MRLEPHPRQSGPRPSAPALLASPNLVPPPTLRALHAAGSSDPARLVASPRANRLAVPLPWPSGPTLVSAQSQPLGGGHAAGAHPMIAPYCVRVGAPEACPTPRAEGSSDSET